MKKLSAAFFTILLVLNIGNTHAKTSAVNILKEFNARTESISGNFSQTVGNKRKAQTTHGTFQVLRPNLFKWQYLSPYKQTIVADGQIIWFYDEDLAQVTKSAQKQIISSSPIAILASKSVLESHYTLQEDGSADGIDYVRALPKQSYADYQYIRIGFRNNILAAMQLKDGFGNEINIRFDQINLNANLKRSGFGFTPPAGVDVLSQ